MVGFRYSPPEISTTGGTISISQALRSGSTGMILPHFYILAASDLKLLFFFIPVTLFIFYSAMKKHSQVGILSKAYYRAVLMEKLDSLGAEVIKIQNISGPVNWGGVQVFRVNFVTRRGHKIDGYFYVGHRVHGLVYGHIRFRKQYVKEEDTRW